MSTARNVSCPTSRAVHGSGRSRRAPVDHRRVTEESGFESLARTYARLIRSAIHKVAGADSDRLGADIEQRLLTDLWKRQQGGAPIDHPSTYIYRAAVRETVRALKRDARRAEAPLSPWIEAGPRDDPYALLRRREIETALNEELDAILPDRARAVRFHLAGFEVADIMSLQGWSYQKARNLIARGMADVRSRLRNRGIDAG